LIITKKTVEPKTDEWASFDVNLTNITLIGNKIERYDARGLYHIHRVYKIKRRRIQKLSKLKA
jgi:putative transposase